MANLIFIAAGGRGTRLWRAFPELEKSNLPKSLGIKVNDRPLIAYQLDKLVRAPNVQIILSFCDKRSIGIFRQYIREGKISRFEYLYNLDPCYPQNATIDILRSSYPHKLWEDDFETITIATGDVYFDSQHFLKMNQLYKLKRCSVQTLCDFEEYMVTLKHHFHPLYDKSGKLKHIKEDDKLPKEIICHPQLLTKRAFEIYQSLPRGTTKSEFVNQAIRRGERFMVLRPKEYVNVNFPQDVKKLLASIF